MSKLLSVFEAGDHRAGDNPLGDHADNVIDPWSVLSSKYDDVAVSLWLVAGS